MKKNNIIVQIVLYSILALVLISLLGGLLSGHRFRSFGLKWFGNDISINSFEHRSSSYVSDQMTGSQDISADQLAQLTKISIEMPSQHITIVDSTDGQMHIKQYGKSAKSSFTTYTENGVLTIKGDPSSRHRVLDFFGSSYARQAIEIALPDSYTGDLSIDTSAGETYFEKPMKLKNISLNSSAGEFASNYPIECETIQATLSAGSIDFYQLTASDYNITATTGDIEVERLYGGGKMGITMGEIDVNIYGITGKASFDGTLGDINLEVQPGVEFSFTGSRTVGDLEVNFPCQYNDTSVTGQVGSSAENQLSASITAGNLSVEIDD